MRRAGLTASLILLAQAAPAGPPELFWPLDCVQGATCYIEDYVDADPGPGQNDYTCGLKSRDGHRGTDIVLEDFTALERGVTVVAAAPGVVSALRDGMEDVPVTAETRAALDGRECGNAVRLDHAGGWQTLYCHLRQGSITVTKGQSVTAGAPLGLVGMSGLTNIPHLHLTVLKDGQVVDPFRPAPPAGELCGAPGDTLWAEPPAYHRAGIFTAGMSTGIPEFEAVRSGSARRESARPIQPLVVYTHLFQAETGDLLTLSARGPEGEIFAHSEVLKAPKVSQMKAYGREAPLTGWPEGRYRGIVRLERKGELIAWRHADIEVTSR